MPDGKPSHNLSQSIVKALLYSDIFNYPLTSREIFYRLGTNHVGVRDVEHELIKLQQKGFVYQFDQFYSVRNEPTLAESRRKGNHIAGLMMPKAYKRARLIYNFPFVRSVMISGSLSKDYMDEKSDFDYFIITKPGRLWIARTLMVLFKRLVFRGSHRFFCVNYFIDTDHLEIEEQNIFTATELATLIPVYGQSLYPELVKANTWLRDYFPNFQPHPVHDRVDAAGSWKSIAEKLLNFSWLDTGERFLMKYTIARWIKKYREKYPQSDFQVAFKSKAYVSKNHPNHYQKKITELYDKKVKSFLQQNPQLAEA